MIQNVKSWNKTVAYGRSAALNETHICNFTKMGISSYSRTFGRRAATSFLGRGKHGTGIREVFEVRHP